MLRYILPFLILTSCSLNKVDGGEKSYVYKSQDYDLAVLKDMAPDLIRTSRRDPPEAPLKKLFSKKMPDLNRIGIIVFESKIQETRSGLSNSEGKFFPTAAGKQILTEKFLRIWEEAFPIIDPVASYVPVKNIIAAKSYSHYGQEPDDYVKSSLDEFQIQDFPYLPKGKKTTIDTVMSPRGMRDFSLLLVPAADLMGGAKWSEHQKLMVNDVAKELGLDALLIIMSQASWTGSFLRTKIEGTIVIPASQYRDRLLTLKKSPVRGVTLSYRNYVGEIISPIQLQEATDEWDMDQLEQFLLTPLFRTYRDLSLMMMIQMKKDLDETR
jgi:hypothetical protein